MSLIEQNISQELHPKRMLIEPNQAERIAKWLSGSQMDVYTDGACINNGMPGATGGMGVWSDDLKIQISAPWLEEDVLPTNQRCEMMAVAIALAVTANVEHEIRILSDSEYVVKGLNEWVPRWKNRGWTTSKGHDVKNRWLWETLDDMRLARNVTFEHVRGHVGIHGNEQADMLAVQAAEGLNS